MLAAAAARAAGRGTTACRYSSANAPLHASTITAGVKGKFFHGIFLLCFINLN